MFGPVLKYEYSKVNGLSPIKFTVPPKLKSYISSHGPSKSSPVQSVYGLNFLVRPFIIDVRKVSVTRK